MSKERIKEMAKKLWQFAPILSENNCRYVAERAYEAGYRKQSEWISVGERLPEKEQIVLCCLGLVMNVYTYKGDRIWEDSYGYWQKDEPITHWMPLPEPPKGE